MSAVSGRDKGNLNALIENAFILRILLMREQMSGSGSLMDELPVLRGRSLCQAVPPGPRGVRTIRRASCLRVCENRVKQD